MGTEQRRAERRVVKVKTLLAVGDADPMRALTIDVSMQGVGMIVPSPVKPGSKAQIEFDLYHDGKSHLVRAIAKCVHCIFSGGQFRAGFEFEYLEPSGKVAIIKFLL